MPTNLNSMKSKMKLFRKQSYCQCNYPQLCKPNKILKQLMVLSDVTAGPADFIVVSTTARIA